MTGLEIAALAEAGLQMIVKIAELVQAANKGDVTSAEVLKRIVDSSATMKAATDEVREYLDEKFDK